MPQAPQQQEQLDPSIVRLAQAISKTETRGTKNPYQAKGGSGEYGAYQYTAPTWQADSKAFLGQEVPLDQATPEQQDKVAYYKIQSLGKQGYKPNQIASIWNSGKPDPTGNVGVNKSGVKYDTPGYVKSVEQAYNQLQQGQQVNVPPTTSTVGNTQTGIPDAQQPDTYGASFPASPTDSPLAAGAKSLGNVPSSAINLGKSLLTAISHPVKTGEGIVGGIIGLGSNIAQTLASQIDPKWKDVPPNKFQKLANSIGKSLSDRYGSLENAQRTATNDPVGFGTDVMMLLQGGAAALDKTLGTTGADVASRTASESAANFSQTGLNVMPKVGEGVAQGALNSGISAVGKPVVSAIKGVASAPFKLAGQTLGLQTGVGAQPISQGLSASAEGGDANKAFLEGLRGNSTPDQLVSQARDLLGQVVDTRSNTYKDMLASLGKDKTTYDISPIYNEVDSQLSKFGITKAEDGLDFSRSKFALDTTAQRDIENLYNYVKSYGGKAGDRTALGVDNLKQVLGGYYSPNSDYRAFTQAIKGATRSVLEDAPGYSKSMSDYSDMTDTIKDIKQSLSLGDNAAIETSFKKLISALKNNDFRKQVIEGLDQATGGQLLPKIAGYQLSSPIPRGLAGAFEGGLGSATAILAPASIPALLGLAFTTSPRVVGEFVHALGLGVRGTNAIMGLLNKFTTPASAVGAGLLNRISPSNTSKTPTQ